MGRHLDVGHPLRGHYQLIDHLGSRVGSLMLPPFFRDGTDTESIESHVEQLRVSIPTMTEPGWYLVDVDSPIGSLTSGILVASDLRPDRPSVIFHHGIGELPADTSFNRIFRPERDLIDANLIAVQAPFHTSSSALTTGIASLRSVLIMQAASVELIEAIRAWVGEQTTESVIVSGVSLGGFITNLHHIVYQSADRYIPLLAGLAQDDVFLNSSIRRYVSRTALDEPDTISDRLNFTDAFAETDPTNVHPLLAKHDRVVRFDPQAASYHGRPIETIGTGHLTGAVAAQALRSHIARFVRLEQTRRDRTSDSKYTQRRWHYADRFSDIDWLN